MKSLPLYLVLNNWTDYYTRKLNQGQNPAEFNPDEKWETEYLIKRIQMLFPQARSSSIAKAIDIIGSTGVEDRQQMTFVHRVLVQLCLYDYIEGRTRG